MSLELSKNNSHEVCTAYTANFIISQTLSGNQSWSAFQKQKMIIILDISNGFVFRDISQEVIFYDSKSYYSQN